MVPPVPAAEIAGMYVSTLTSATIDSTHASEYPAMSVLPNSLYLVPDANPNLDFQATEV